jgi:hypothetical protein
LFGRTATALFAAAAAGAADASFDATGFGSAAGAEGVTEAPTGLLVDAFGAAVVGVDVTGVAGVAGAAAAAGAAGFDVTGVAGVASTAGVAGVPPPTAFTAC